MKEKARARVGKRIVASLREFTEALEAGADVFTCYQAPHPPAQFSSTHYTPELVRQTRALLQTDVPSFAGLLGVTPRTVASWKGGEARPSGPARRFLDEIRRDPAYWSKRLREAAFPAGA